VHGFTSGADRGNLAVEWVACTGGVFVFLLVALRLLAPRRTAARTAPVPVTTPDPSEATARQPVAMQSAEAEAEAAGRIRRAETEAAVTAHH
jgi:hypothetical protein